MSKKAYLNTDDIKAIYIDFAGNTKGMNSFIERAKEVAEKAGNAYLYKDEEALFKVFEYRFRTEFQAKKVYNFSDLMQYTRADIDL